MLSPCWLTHSISTVLTPSTLRPSTSVEEKKTFTEKEETWSRVTVEGSLYSYICNSRFDSHHHWHHQDSPSIFSENKLDILVFDLSLDIVYTWYLDPNNGYREPFLSCMNILSWLKCFPPFPVYCIAIFCFLLSTWILLIEDAQCLRA